MPSRFTLRAVLRVEDDELEFVLTFADYVDECRIACVEPLTLKALREPVTFLTEGPTVH